MEGSFEFSDERLEALKQELLEIETFRRLREMTLEQLDDIFNQCCEKERTLTKRAEELERQFILINEFVEKYLAPVYLEEHGIDLMEDDIYFEGEDL
jgi:hypothetical protein